MTTTPKLGIPRASLSADADIEETVNTALDRVDAITGGYDQGPIADRPAPAGLSGFAWWATDAEVLYRSDGTKWRPVVELPIGSVIDWPAAGTPGGGGEYLELLGQTITQAIYPELFDAWQVEAATIVLPDRRGRTQLGAGTGAGLTPRAVGATGGEERHTITRAEVPSLPVRVIDEFASGAGGPFVVARRNGPENWIVGTGGALANPVNPTSPNDPANVMQPFTVTRYFVRAR